MTKTNSQNVRRTLVVLLYISYFLMFDFIQFHPKASPIFTIGKYVVIILFVIIALYFINYLLKKTEIKNILRNKDNRLDERQIMVRNNVYRESYAVLMAAIGYMTVFAIMNDPDEMFGDVNTIRFYFITLLFLGISIPAAILAWTEKEI